MAAIESRLTFALAALVLFAQRLRRGAVGRRRAQATREHRAATELQCVLRMQLAVLQRRRLRRLEAISCIQKAYRQCAHCNATSRLVFVRQDGARSAR
eukprot:SAG11_NODE_1074_length_5968_cov_2.041063_8_plen_98_part_00